MTNEELLSRTISCLRFPLTVGVAFIHFSLAKGLDVQGVSHGLDNPDWYFFVVNFVSSVLASVSVPLFFVFAGFLFFYRRDFDGSVYRQKLKSRAMTLFVPYIMWNIAVIFWKLTKDVLLASSSYSNSVEIHLSFVRIFNTFFCNTTDNGIFVYPSVIDSSSGVFPINVPLWFVRDLMVLVILSPVIYWLIKKAGVWFVVVLCIAWYTTQLYLTKGSYAAMLITASFFFSLGAFFSIRKENIVFVFRKFRYAPAIYIVVALADALTKGMEFNVYINKAGIILGIVSAIVVVSCLVEHNKVKVNTTLANSSFFVYALHTLLLCPIGIILFTKLHIPEDNPFAMLALYFATPIITVAICLALYVLIKRYIPKVSNLLTGGR